jgi:hypothetical protein
LIILVVFFSNCQFSWFSRSSNTQGTIGPDHLFVLLPFFSCSLPSTFDWLSWPFPCGHDIFYHWSRDGDLLSFT